MAQRGPTARNQEPWPSVLKPEPLPLDVRNRGVGFYFVG